MIDGRAIIDPSAVLGENVSIGPWSIIGADVELGDNVEVASHVVVKGPAKIGAGVRIFQFSTVGEDTPAFAFAGEETHLTIGENTVIREGVTIHRGMTKGGISRTEVGRNCLLMAYVHIGHDCIVGDHVVMANNASLAGHVVVGDYANFGGYSGIPQFRQIGAYTHIAAMSLVLKDVPAYMTVSGNPAVAVGLNTEGMKRRGYSKETTSALRQAHRIVYRNGLTVKDALAELASLRTEFPEVDLFAQSVESSEWGIIRGRNKSQQQMSESEPDGATIVVGILAGEASGDNLGAGLMQAMQSQSSLPLKFIGVGGEAMLAAGLSALAPLDALSVNGFRDPILKLPELIALLRRLVRTFEQAQIDVFIGVDFNVFNFILEAALRKRGIKTVHYVSPSVYAWRSGRTKRVARSADLLLCLYPFEPAFYAQTSVQAEFVGHPLADEIDLSAGADPARLSARQALGLTAERTVLAMLPGSRNSEVDLMIEHFLGAAALFAEENPGSVTVIPCVRPSIKARVEKALQDYPNLEVTLYEGNARRALVACDVALVKSGTSTLEAMLLHRPMVVSYRLGWWTYQLAKRVLRTPYVALPNILAGRALVPELLQHEGTAQALAQALQQELTAATHGAENTAAFEALHKQLRQGADAKAAASVLRLLAAKVTGS